MLGRKPIIDHQRARAQARAPASDHAGVGLGKAEGERSAVQIQERTTGSCLRHIDPFAADAGAIHVRPPRPRVDAAESLVHTRLSQTNLTDASSAPRAALNGE